MSACGEPAQSMQKITPFLWFDSNAEAAVKFYTSIFKSSKILNVVRYSKGAPGPEGAVMTIRFRILGMEFTALNGGPAFQFNSSVSFVVNCETQEEVDFYWRKLSAGGKKIQCGWLEDKYGISWQVVPTVLFKLIGDKDPDKAARVTQAMLKMVKLDIKRLQAAHAKT